MSAPQQTTSGPAATGGDYDVESVRADFPALHQRVHDKPLIYLDNAASAQKPEAVIEAVSHYYRHDHANVHRGVHELSERATNAYEGAREKARRFLNAGAACEIVFVRGTTEAINLVAQSYGRPRLAAGEEILLTEMEHHSNIVPWQLLAGQTGARVAVAPMNDDGELEMAEYARLVARGPKIVAVTHVSNSLGTINPLEEMIALARAAGAMVLIDGAQAVPHLAVDVQALDCDFYAFSGHKLYGPTGIGVLYGKQALLEAMPPYQGGGEMIKRVTFEDIEYNDIPHKFEAGTPNIAGAVGLGAAIDYVSALGLERIARHENDVLEYATGRLAELSGVRQIGTARDRASIVSFSIDGVHPHDVGTVLDHEGVAVRAGHHCAMPVMQHFGVPATVRASLGVYNTREEIDVLIDGIGKVQELFGV